MTSVKRCLAHERKRQKRARPMVMAGIILKTALLNP
jgi:hypothetical protein